MQALSDANKLISLHDNTFITPLKLFLVPKYLHLEEFYWVIAEREREREREKGIEIHVVECWYLIWHPSHALAMSYRKL